MQPTFSRIRMAHVFVTVFIFAITIFQYLSPESAFSASRAKLAGDLIVRNRGNYVLLEGGVCFSGVTINNIGQFAVHTAERAFGPGTFKSVTKTTNFPYCDKADTRTGAPWPFRMRINLPAPAEVCEKGLRFSATNGFLLEEPLDLGGAVLDFCEKPTPTTAPNPSIANTTSAPTSITAIPPTTTPSAGNCWQTCTDKKSPSFPNGCSADLSCYEYTAGDTNNHCPEGQSSCCWAPKCGGAINCPVSTTPTPTSTSTPTPSTIVTATNTPTPTNTTTPTPAVCNFKATAQVIEVTDNTSGGYNQRIMTEIDDTQKSKWAPQNNLSRQKIGDIRNNPSLSLKGFGVKYTDPGTGSVAVDTNTTYGGQVIVDYQNYPPILPTGPVSAPDRYYRGDVASMYLNYPKDQYSIVGQFCYTGNGMSTYCPPALMAVDPTKGLVGNFSPSASDEAITGLRIDCNVDVTYGWYLKKTGTPPPPPPTACLLRDSANVSKCQVKNIRTVPNANQAVNSHKVTLKWDAMRDTSCFNAATDTYRLDIVEAGVAGVVCSRDIRESTDLLPDGTIQASCDLKGSSSTGKRDNFVAGVPYTASVYVHKATPNSCFSKESNYTFTRPEKDIPEQGGESGGSVEGCQISRGETCIAHPQNTNGQQFCGADRTWVGWCSNASAGVNTSSCCRANSSGGGGGGENPPGGGGSGNQPPGGGGGGGGGGQPGNPPVNPPGGGGSVSACTQAGGTCRQGSSTQGFCQTTEVEGNTAQNNSCQLGGGSNWKCCIPKASTEVPNCEKTINQGGLGGRCIDAPNQCEGNSKINNGQCTNSAQICCAPSTFFKIHFNLNSISQKDRPNVFDLVVRDVSNRQIFATSKAVGNNSIINLVVPNDSLGTNIFIGYPGESGTSIPDIQKTFKFEYVCPNSNGKLTKDCVLTKDWNESRVYNVIITKNNDKSTSPAPAPAVDKNLMIYSILINKNLNIDYQLDGVYITSNLNIDRKYWEHLNTTKQQIFKLKNDLMYSGQMGSKKIFSDDLDKSTPHISLYLSNSGIKFDTLGRNFSLEQIETIKNNYRSNKQTKIEANVSKTDNEKTPTLKITSVK